MPYSDSRTVQSLDDGSLSSVRAVRSLARTRRLSHLLFGTVLALVLSLFVIPWQQTAVGKGRVVAYAPLDRRQNIEAPIDGRIVSWEVREGSRVKKDALIAVISDNDPELVARMRLSLIHISEPTRPY